MWGEDEGKTGMSRLVTKRTRELLILNAYLLFLKNSRWSGGVTKRTRNVLILLAYRVSVVRT